MGIEQIYADRIEEAFQRDLRNPVPPAGPPSFSAWSFLKSGVKGLASGGLESVGSVLDATSGFATPLAASMGDEAARQKMLAGDAFDTSLGNVERKKADEFAPNPETAHTADKVIHGLTRGVSKAVADTTLLGLVPGAVVFGADEGNTATQRLRMEGVDTETAAKVGLGTGVISALTAGIPGVGSTAAKTIGLATLTGPASYVAQEALTRDILQRAGRDDLASMHDPLDPLGLSLSIGIPGAIGGLHIRGLKKAASLQDVVRHIESGGQRYGADGKLLTSPAGAQGEMQVMPGTATDPGFGVTPAKDGSPEELARVGRDYLAAMTARYGEPDKALAAYNAGPGAVDLAVSKYGDKWLDHMPDETKKYVAKADALMGEHIAERGAADPAVVDAARVRVTDDALMRSMPEHPEARSEVLQASDLLAEGKTPSVDPLDIENAFAMKLRDHDAAVQEYAARPDSEGGKVLNTDVARELSPDYLRDRTQSAAVHEPASAFIKRLYAEKLAALQPGDKVMFTSGGTGAGKTTAINNIAGVRALKDDSAIVYDTNMNTLKSAVQKIDQALDAGAKVNIVHVQRDAVEALVNGALPRAMHQAKEFGTGRTVPLIEHARTHRGAAEVVQQLAEKYKDNPNVAIRVIDNTRGKGGARLADLGFVRGFDYNGIEGKLYEALKQQRDAGAISADVFRATEGDAAPSQRNPVRGVDGSEPQQERVGAGHAGAAARLPDPGSVTIKPEAPAALEAAASLDSARVARLAEESPNLKVKLPGSDETLTVAAALKRAEEEAAHEASEADLVKAAFECALGLA